MFNFFVLMSILSYICEYGSDSEDSDCGLDVKKNKVTLPGPRLDKIKTVTELEYEDDPQLHNGRTRSFPHVRGNWATFVFVKYPEDTSLINFIQRIETISKSVCAIEIIQDFHVSLSRTVVLKYHLISSFTTTLKIALQNIPSFYLELDSIKIYCNEDNTRTFVALKVDFLSNKHLLQILYKVNEVLKEYNLPEFYKYPSFHASILWTNGDTREELEKALIELIVVRNQVTLEPVLVDRICCKIGNKLYQFPLD